MQGDAILSCIVHVALVLVCCSTRVCPFHPHHTTCINPLLPPPPLLGAPPCALRPPPPPRAPPLLTTLLRLTLCPTLVCTTTAQTLRQRSTSTTQQQWQHCRQQHRCGGLPHESGWQYCLPRGESVTLRGCLCDTGMVCVICSGRGCGVRYTTPFIQGLCFHCTQYSGGLVPPKHFVRSPAAHVLGSKQSAHRPLGCMGNVCLGWRV